MWRLNFIRKYCFYSLGNTVLMVIMIAAISFMQMKYFKQEIATSLAMRLAKKAA